MKKFIYADNAATSKLDMDAFEAMKLYLLQEFGNVSQPYSFSRKPKKALQKAREIIATCIGAMPDEIYFTSGGTESDNWAIKCINLNQNKKKIITSSIEHHAVLNACKFMESFGYKIKYLNVDNEGTINSSTLEEAIDNTTSLVSIMYANNEIGTIQDIKTLCDISHSNGALFHCDAVQAIGHVKINVKDLGVDLLSASAHKFNGPKGVGFLYVKKGTHISSFFAGGSQENDLRAGTENIASIVGMAVALKNNCDNIENNVQHNRKLEDLFIRELDKTNIKYIKNGAKDKLPGLLSLSFRNSDGEAILHRLDLSGICVSTGAACNSTDTQVSHVINAISVDKAYEKGTIRISFGKDNTDDDVHEIVSALCKIFS